MTSLRVICGLGLSPIKNSGYAFELEIAWKIFLLTFFLENTCACVLGPWPWPRAFLSLASRRSVLGKAVLGHRFFLCPWPWPRALCPRLHLCWTWTLLKFSCLLRLLGKFFKSQKPGFSPNIIYLLKTWKQKWRFLWRNHSFQEYDSILSELRDSFVLMSRANLLNRFF